MAKIEEYRLSHDEECVACNILNSRNL